MSKQETSTDALAPFRTSIGGQALIEGIYMRGPDKQSIVVRNQDGELVVKTEELRLTPERHPVLKIPFVRGIFAFLGTMVEGVKALLYSADFYPDEDEENSEPSKLDLWLDRHLSSKALQSIVVGFTVAFSLVFTIALFFLLPTVVTSLLKLLIPMIPLVQNLIEGAIRVVIFLLYLFLVSKTKDMRRVFSYHGAEHKSIFCYERRLELTVENVRQMPSHHPRCGTSFMFVVIVIAIICYSVLFTLLTPPNVFVRILCQLLLIPVIVGIAYEFNHYVGRHDNRFTKICTKPGLWMQNFTVFEPDDSMIEVGIASLKQVIPEEAGKDKW